MTFEGIFSWTIFLAKMTLVSSSLEMFSLNMVFYSCCVFWCIITQLTLPRAITQFYHILVDYLWQFLNTKHDERGNCQLGFAMISMIVHSVRLSIFKLLVTHFTHNSWSFNMFRLNMVDNISLNTRHIITFCALKLVQVVLDKHGPNNPIKFFKRNSSCNSSIIYLHFMSILS